MRALKHTIFLLLILSFAVSFSTYSQVKTTTSKWKSPLLTIEIAGSFDLPISDTRGQVGDFFKFMNYGTTVGWGGKFNFKFGLGQKGDIRPYVSLSYTQLQGSDNSTAFIGPNWIQTTTGYPLPGNSYYGDPTNSYNHSVPGSSKIILRIPQIGAGFEYAFVMVDKKKRAFIPFIGADLDLSVVTGIYRQTPQYTTSGQPGGRETAFNIKPDVRFGFGIGAGADVRFIPNFGMAFGIKYKFVNLFGKSSDFLAEENKMNLLDKAAANLNSNLYKDRNLTYMEFYLGGAIYLGKSKK